MIDRGDLDEALRQVGDFQKRVVKHYEAKSKLAQQAKSLTKSVLPARVLASLRSLHDLSRSIIRSPVTKLKCKSMKGVRVNVGCGPNPTPGWINLDVFPHPEIMHWDCRKALPFNNSTVDVIYTEHFFEHIEYEEAKELLRECLRCLKPKGTLRIVVPDDSVWSTKRCRRYGAA